ncbi:MAG: peptide deformylase [Bacteroidales bacterium]|nr:peptide deformylase [Candidatus Equibacterium intestinale]
MTSKLKQLISAILLTLLSAGCAVSGAGEVRTSVTDDTLVFHNIVVDEQGCIVPWNNPDPAVAFNEIIYKVTDFWRNMQPASNGLPYYMVHQVWKPEEDPRGLGGDQLNMMLSSWRLLYAYTGWETLKAEMQAVADYYLAHSLSSSDALWPDIPYPYNCDIQSGEYDGDMLIGKGFTQPDKAGSFGFELVNLYKMTGREEYLQAAVKIAACLCANLRRDADISHSPWPFKVHASTGEVRPTSEYTAAYEPTLELLLALQELDPANSAEYRKVFDFVNGWMVDVAYANQKWGPFFEDCTEASETQMNAVKFAQFVMNHHELYPDWERMVQDIFDWSEEKLANHSWEQYGVTPMNEQTCYYMPGNSHSARQACAGIQFEALHGREAAHRDVRRLAWATYMVAGNGANQYYHDDVWMTDGYGDYIRHYLRAMAFDPQQLATPYENHILSSTSVLGNVSYIPGQICYAAFDADGKEVVRLAARPGKVKGEGGAVAVKRTRCSRGGWLLEINRSGARDISIALKGAPKAAARLSKGEKALINSGDSLMRVLQINDFNDSYVLRAKSVDFTLKDLKSSEFEKLCRRMVYTVNDTCHPGVGIAAPQVGINRRLVVVQRFDKEGRPFEIYPNITIRPAADSCSTGWEGCLSVPDRKEQVARWTAVEITYTDPSTLQQVSETVTGYTAVIFQHETDHLEGLLYTDRIPFATTAEKQ